MQHRTEIVTTLTQFKSVYRRHLHPDIKKKINLPSIGINRKSLHTMSDSQLVAKTKKLIQKIDAVQFDRDREHKGLKAFTSHLKEFIDDTSKSIPNAHNQLIQLVHLLSVNHGDENLDEIERLAKIIKKCSSNSIIEQAKKAIEVHVRYQPDLQAIISKILK